jgi:hypothetical protein
MSEDTACRQSDKQSSPIRQPIGNKHGTMTRKWLHSLPAFGAIIPANRWLPFEPGTCCQNAARDQVFTKPAQPLPTKENESQKPQQASQPASDHSELSQPGPHSKAPAACALTRHKRGPCRTPQMQKVANRYSQSSLRQVRLMHCAALSPQKGYLKRRGVSDSGRNPS